MRFLMRIRDPLKQWKLSPMDLESRRRWELYTKAKEEMLERTHIPEARWWVVEGVDKKAIVKINDVGPLTPGRVIDFNEQTMRYFDPTLQRGVIQNVRVTHLSGDDWTPGPIAQR